MFIKNHYYLFTLATIVILNRAYLSYGNEICLDLKRDDAKSIEIHKANVSRIFDVWLPNLRQEIINGGLDPMKLPDFMVDQLALPGNIKGNISLDHGWLQDLSTIRRPGDVILKYTTKTLIFNVSLGWGTLDFTYEYFLRIFPVSRSGDVFGRVHDLDLRIILLFDLADYKFELQHFEFINVGEFFVRLQGNSADNMINAVAKLIVSVFKERIVKQIELKFEDIIERELNDLNDKLNSHRESTVQSIFF